jgi:hypothetical protein
MGGFFRGDSRLDPAAGLGIGRRGRGIAFFVTRAFAVDFSGGAARPGALGRVPVLADAPVLEDAVLGDAALEDGTALEGDGVALDDSEIGWPPEPAPDGGATASLFGGGIAPVASTPTAKPTSVGWRFRTFRRGGSLLSSASSPFGFDAASSSPMGSVMMP